MAKFNPVDYNMPEGFRYYDGDPAEDHIGPFFYRRRDGITEGALRVQAHHCNLGHTTHGGILMSLADYCVCMAVFGDEELGVLTVSMNSDFIGPSNEGELIIGEATVSRRTRSLAFIRCDLKVDERVILSTNAVVKPILPR